MEVVGSRWKSLEVVGSRWKSLEVVGSRPGAAGQEKKKRGKVAIPARRGLLALAALLGRGFGGGVLLLLGVALAVELREARPKLDPRLLADRIAQILPLGTIADMMEPVL